MRTAIRIAALSMAALLPVAAMADKPAHAGNGHGKGKPQAMVKKAAQPGRSARAERRGSEARGVPGVAGTVRDVQAADCPPGLAKKSPACIPPGLAKKRVGVGDVISAGDIHWVRRPGLYGLGEAPDGSRYAVVGGQLVRLDRDSYKVLSVLRAVDALLD